MNIPHEQFKQIICSLYNVEKIEWMCNLQRKVRLFTSNVSFLPPLKTMALFLVCEFQRNFHEYWLLWASKVNNKAIDYEFKDSKRATEKNESHTMKLLEGTDNISHVFKPLGGCLQPVPITLKTSQPLSTRHLLLFLLCLFPTPSDNCKLDILCGITSKYSRDVLSFPWCSFLLCIFLCWGPQCIELYCFFLPS